MSIAPPRTAATAALTRGLAADAADEVARAAVARELDAGELLFLQGDPVEALFVVASGALRLVQHTPDGAEIVVRTMTAGDIVAGVAILDKRQYPVSAIAETACAVLLWPKARIQELVARHPAMRGNILGAIADRMHDSLSRIRELSTDHAPQRIANALLRLARDHGRPEGSGTLIDHPLGRQQLADLAGASMFTASRLLASWARDGILDVGRQRVVVLSLERLRAIAAGRDAGHG